MAQARVLVVDDVEMNRDLLSECMSDQGHDVTTVEDGYEALGQLAKSRFDLVLLDIMMPGITGIDVLKVIRKTQSATDLPVVMVTSLDESKDMVQALGEGANDYITKPIDFAVLVARVSAQLRMKNARQADDSPTLISGSPVKQKLGPGTVLGDRYRLADTIGSGGFGTVYEAHHLGLDHPIAVKVLNSQMEATQEHVASFQREGIASCRIQHPNAVSVFDFGITPDGVPFLVMERLVGRSLKEEMTDFYKIPAARCAEIIEPVCDVLSLIHDSKIIHRDIKPQNIFLHEGPRGETVKVLDFGIAKLLDPVESGAVDRQIIGTPTYMAPERLCGREYDWRSDVYSVGLLAYEMLSGTKAFQVGPDLQLSAFIAEARNGPRPLHLVAPTLPHELTAIVQEALSVDPASRPSAAGFAMAFGKAARSAA